jgi:hypothetical protein
VLTLTANPRSYHYSAQECISNCLTRVISDPETAKDVLFLLK